MDCQRIQEHLSDYVDGTLENPRAAAMVETHLARCESCQQEVNDLRRMVAALRSLPPLAPPAYFVHGVQARITEDARTPRTGLPVWLYPSRGGFSTRLAAAAIVAIALVPPVRQGFENGALGLFNPAGVKAPAPSEPGNNPAPPPAEKPQTTGTTSAADTSHAVPKATAGVTTSTSTAPVSPATKASVPAPSRATPTEPPTMGPIPLQRPSAIPETHIRFTLNRDVHPSSIAWVNISVFGNRDFTDCQVDATVMPPAHFVDEAGRSLGVQRNLWSGNLAEDVPTNLGAPVMLDGPGVYSLRVVVRNNSGILASSSLMLPAGLPNSPVNIETPPGGTDMYTAMGTWASQAGHPVVVEDGLRGTRPLQLHSQDSQAVLTSLVSEFQCGLFQQNGMNYVVLHPESTPARGGATRTLVGNH